MYLFDLKKYNKYATVWSGVVVLEVFECCPLWHLIEQDTWRHSECMFSDLVTLAHVAPHLLCLFQILRHMMSFFHHTQKNSLSLAGIAKEPKQCFYINRLNWTIFIYFFTFDCQDHIYKWGKIDPFLPSGVLPVVSLRLLMVLSQGLEMNQLLIESINANKIVQEGESLWELCKKRGGSMNFPLSYHAAIPSVIRFDVQSSCGDPGYLRVSCTAFCGFPVVSYQGVEEVSKGRCFHC